MKTLITKNAAAKLYTVTQNAVEVAQIVKKGCYWNIKIEGRVIEYSPLLSELKKLVTDFFSNNKFEPVQTADSFEKFCKAAFFKKINMREMF
jgi:hypothetical protein